MSNEHAHVQWTSNSRPIDPSCVECALTRPLKSHSCPLCPLGPMCPLCPSGPFYPMNSIHKIHIIFIINKNSFVIESIVHNKIYPIDMFNGNIVVSNDQCPLDPMEMNRNLNNFYYVHWTSICPLDTMDKNRIS